MLIEIPAGVFADTISRKWSLVVSHALMGTAMIATGLVTDFELLVLTQMLWGLSWTFASGADVAWITDELDQPERISGVLDRGRGELICWEPRSELSASAHSLHSRKDPPQ